MPEALALMALGNVADIVARLKRTIAPNNRFRSRSRADSHFSTSNRMSGRGLHGPIVICRRQVDPTAKSYRTSSGHAKVSSLRKLDRRVCFSCLTIGGRPLHFPRGGFCVTRSRLRHAVHCCLDSLPRLSDRSQTVCPFDADDIRGVTLKRTLAR